MELLALVINGIILGLFVNFITAGAVGFLGVFFLPFIFTDKSSDSDRSFHIAFLITSVLSSFIFWFFIR